MSGLWRERWSIWWWEGVGEGVETGEEVEARVGIEARSEGSCQDHVLRLSRPSGSRQGRILSMSETVDRTLSGAGILVCKVRMEKTQRSDLSLLMVVAVEDPSKMKQADQVDLAVEVEVEMERLGALVTEHWNKATKAAYRAIVKPAVAVARAAQEMTMDLAKEVMEVQV